MLRLILTGLLVFIDLCRADFEDPAPLKDNQPPYWYSEAFRYECFHRCPAESHSNLAFTKGTEAASGNCAMKCPTAMQRSEWLPNTRKTVYLSDPRRPNYTPTTCVVQIVKEDVTCLRIRGKSFGADCQHQRRNHRYYLEKSCDSETRFEVGEETCREACTATVAHKNSISIDVNQTRAIFRPCYRGLISLDGIRRSMDFCRAELKPCSTCFKWGNWTLASPCSKTCGSRGVEKYVRDCFIMERSDLRGRSAVYVLIKSRFCKAYLGGDESKTEECGMQTVCPQWTNWSTWTECDLSKSERKKGSVDTKDMSTRKKCRHKRTRRDITVNSAKDTVTLTSSLQSVQNVSNANSNISSNSLKVISQNTHAAKHTTSIRSRVCLPARSGKPVCPGNSTQSRTCNERIKQNDETADVLDKDECEGEETDESTTTEFVSTELTETSTRATTQQKYEETTVTTASPRQHKKPKKGNNRTFTVENEGGFASVINNYAVVLITSLLIFIVLLLFALIAICWKVMKRSRRNRYEAPPPSFSAGTLGSIPGSLAHGYPHPLGLRNGSGTFGRSEYPPNLSDAFSSKGSWRSCSSRAAKGTSRSKHRVSLSANGMLATGSVRQNTRNTRISLSELIKHQASWNEHNMGSKKPSASSLLSSAPSVAGTTISMSSCPLQPLLPPDLPPITKGMPFTKKVESNNPDESCINSTATSRNQPRTVSLSGRSMELSLLQDERSHIPPRVERSSLAKRLQSLEYQHEQYSRRGTNDAKDGRSGNITRTENEYWSVPREEGSLPYISPLAETRKEHQPLSHVHRHVEATEFDSRQRLSSHQSIDSTEFESTQLIDKVLYNERKENNDCNLQQSSSEGLSLPCDDNCIVDANEESSEEPLYNFIHPTESSIKGTNSESSSPENEGEYDHLYKDSSTPNSPKSPHARNMQMPKTNNTSAGHNYEFIDSSK